MTLKVSITSSHDGGNIKLVTANPILPTISGRTAKCTISLHVQPDVFTQFENFTHMQYFSFRTFVSGLTDDIKLLTIHYEIANAHAVSYPEAWPGSTVFYTNGGLDAPADDEAWRRNLTTKYTDGKLMWTQVHNGNGSTFFSYFPPYSYNRHLKLIADCASVANAVRGGVYGEYNPVVESLGLTKEGREMECISIGRGDSVAWVIHRQHPGETMAEFFAEGLLHRLLGIGGVEGELEEVTRRVLENYRLYIVPCMCPDGAVHGHLRTNAVGANLNREWATVKDDYVAPSLERSPEVHAVLNKMDSTGCDFFLDVHGDEELPYVFFSGAEKTPVWGDRIEHLHGYFISCFQKVNSDVQKAIGYPPPDNVQAALNHMNVGTNQVSNRFRCLGLTLEMPYKDCATNPDPDVGFSPNRAKQLGRNLLEALDGVQPYLRAEGEFWSEFGAEDRYVVPTDDFKEEGFIMLKKRLYSDVRPQNN